jgi:hypothetical protein
MTEQTEKNPTLTTSTATPTLTINREHAAIHLAILGDREKYLLTIKDLANDKGHNEEKTKVELITFTEETNNKGLVSWVSLNPKVSDGTVNVTALAVFWLDIDAERPKERAADQYELQEAYDRALALKNYFEKTYNAVCFIAFSGNGYHLYFPLPITAIAPETRETVNLKVRAFAKNTAVRVNKVIDTTYDINRKTTLIGSYNLKYGNIVQTYWLKDFLPETQEWALKSVENARHKNQSLLDAILDTSTEQQQTTKRDITKPHLKLEEILKQDQKLNDLYNGNWKKYGYPTRSEAEAAVLTILFGRYGVSTDEAQEAMKSCKIGKWQEKPGSYQDITLQKAQKWIIDQDEDFKAKTEPIIPGDIKKSYICRCTSSFGSRL